MLNKNLILLLISQRYQPNKRNRSKTVELDQVSSTSSRKYAVEQLARLQG